MLFLLLLLSALTGPDRKVAWAGTLSAQLQGNRLAGPVTAVLPEASPSPPKVYLPGYDTRFA